MANGIISRAAAQPEPQAQAQPPVQEQPDQQQASPANQVDVERVVFAATKILHDPKVKPQILQMMQAAGDPVKALVDATFLVMTQLNEKAGGKIPSEAMGAASFHVLNLVGELAMAAKLYKITPEIIRAAAESGIERLEQMHAQAGQQQAQAAPTAEATAPSEEEVY